jgi:beta-glucanase (GH16 family)
MRRVGTILTVGMVTTALVATLAAALSTDPNADASPCASPSGECLPAANLPGWELLFADDFTTPVAAGTFPGPLADRWWAYPSPWPDTTRYGTYDPDTISVADGVMTLALSAGPDGAQVAAPVPLVAGVKPSGYPDGRVYGRYAARFRAEPTPGFKLSWLLWPTSEAWPAEGEIDFPEGSLDRTMQGFVHRTGATTGDDKVGFDTGVGYGDWHTVVIEWTADRVRFLLDGAEVGVQTERVPSTRMHWVLQSETSPLRRPAAGATARVDVDWVAVWAPRPSAAASRR